MPRFYSCLSRLRHLVAVIILLCVAPLAARAQALPPVEGLVADSTELRVLREFYAATGGPQWNNHTNWLSGTTLANAATWYGVVVQNGDVVRLDFYGNNLRGTLPASLGNLRQLQVLSLAVNQLTGGVPVSIGQLRQLREFYLWQNQFNAPLPRELGQLDSLRVMGLQQNAFPGSIPAELGRLKRLQALNLGVNQLTGAIPAELGQLTQLQQLDLYANQLSGPIPGSLGQLARLQQLALAANGLTGPLPPELGQLQALEQLEMWQNAFQDSIPAAWGGMRALQSVNLNQAGLIGRLPHELGRWTALRSLGASLNQLTGPLPMGLSELPELLDLDLEYNQLSGPLPARWTPALRALRLGNNRFSGTLPAALTAATALGTLRLGNNQLTGPIPSAWGRLTALTEFWLGNNQLTGSLPDSLAGLTRVTYFDVSQNQLTGSLPDSLGNWAALSVLYLQQNQFSGPLPASLAHNPNLYVLNAANNRFTGELPPAWAGMARMSQLDLSTNQLRGSLAPLLGMRNLSGTNLSNNRLDQPLPAGLGQLPRLSYLYLANNQLTGPVPAALGNLGQLYHLILDGNHLSGTLPASVVRLPNISLLLLGGNDLTDIEDLNGATGLPASLSVAGNRLGFAALERLRQGPGQLRVAYLAARWQRAPEQVDTVRYRAGQPLTLTPRVPALAAAHTFGYQWQRLVAGQWVDLPGDTLATKAWPAAGAAEQGTYRRAEHNRWFTDPNLSNTELYSAMLYADLLPYAPLARNRPDDTTTGVAIATPLAAPDAGAAAVNDMNFVRSWVPRVAITDSVQVRQANVDMAAVSTTYLDGLGRPLQTVQRQASPNRLDLVQPQNYDALGREPKQYLPYAAQADNLHSAQGYYYRALDDQTRFYSRTTPPSGGAGPLTHDDVIQGVARTGRAFAESVFEASPLNRVVAQGAAGEAWQVGNGHVVERAERPNTAADSVLRFAPGYDPTVLTPGFQGFYAPGELWGTDVADVHGPSEIGAHGYRTVEWKDKQGQVVLRQVEANRTGTTSSLHSRWLRTAYAYDDFGHLRYVVQPEGTKRMLADMGLQARTIGLQLWLPLDEAAGTQTRDWSGAGHDGTLVGGGTWLPTGGHDGGGALALDHNQTLTVPLNWQPTRFTVAFWLRPTDLFGGPTSGSQQTGAASGWGAFRFQSSAFGDVYVGTDQATALHVATYGTVAAQVWQQFVFSFENGVGTLYKNGQMLSQRTGMALPQAWQGFQLGITGREVYDEVRVYDRALSSAEVAAQFAGPAAPFTFHYRYDGRGRQIAKQVPGTDGETLVVYDQLDRPVLSQDAAQRLRREWSFTKYDALGRVVLSGLVVRGDTAGQVTLQNLADTNTDPANQYEQRTADAQFPYFYTTNQSFPKLGQNNFGNGLVLSATYYDDYNFDNDAAGVADASYNISTDSQFPSGAAPVADALRTTGMTTRTKTRVLGVDPADQTQAAWLTTTTFYDERTRPVQVQTTNARKGMDLLTTQLDFTGKVVQSVAVHEGPNHTPLTVAEFFTYDHTGRLLTTRQQLPGEAKPTRIDSVAYNEIGQATQKTMGKGRLAQQVDFAYNIRGWLTSLNDPYHPNPTKHDLFNLSLHYEQGFTKDYAQYNGNLTGQTWRSARDGVQRAYGYVYDPLNRLLQGDFVARTTTTTPATPTAGLWKAEEDNYRLSFASYDDNGNLLTLRRRGLLANATHATTKRFGPVDELRYAYAGNRLQAVDDQVNTNQLPRPLNYNGAPSSLAGDFQEGGTHLGQEYLYDANGNLTQDRNKGITGIAYNHLNLPRQIHFGIGADSIVFRYSAAGQKVAKLVYQTGKPVLRTDYLGPYQYEQDSLRFFPHAEGRVLRFANTTSGAVRYEREFTFKDHLGNLRLAYRLGQVRTLTATLEQDATTHGRESQQFDSLSVSPPVAVPTGLARTGAYAARLNAGGSAPRPLGPLTQFAVQKGDTVRATAFGLYPQATSSNSFSLLAFIAGLLQPAPAGTLSSRDGSRRGGLPLLQVGLSSAALLPLLQTPGGVPKGYLRVLSFNEDSVLVDQRTVQLTDSALNNYQALRSGPLIVQHNGYVSVYVGNESAADVYFDDVTIEHRQGLQVQENQYDPFGLDLAGVSGAAPGLRLKNFYQFNGKERQNDLGLNWSDYGARMYNAQLGRWSVTDPLGEKYYMYSPYNYVLNNPVKYIDPNGKEVDIQGEKHFVKDRKKELQAQTNDKVKIDKSGNVTLKQRNRAGKEEGTAALRQLVSSSHKNYVRETKGQNETRHYENKSSDLHDGTGANTMIMINPNVKVPVLEQDGQTRTAPGSIVTGHEMMHALLINAGTVPVGNADPSGPNYAPELGGAVLLDKNEVKTREMENVLRDEQGVTRRTVGVEYGAGINLPDVIVKP